MGPQTLWGWHDCLPPCTPLPVCVCVRVRKLCSSHDRCSSWMVVKKNGRQPGFEPGTSCTQSRNHTTRLLPLTCQIWKTWQVIPPFRGTCFFSVLLLCSSLSCELRCSIVRPSSPTQPPFHLLSCNIHPHICTHTHTHEDETANCWSFIFVNGHLRGGGSPSWSVARGPQHSINPALPHADAYWWAVRLLPRHSLQFQTVSLHQ